MATISASAVTAALSRKIFDADLSSSTSLFFSKHRAAGLAMTSTRVDKYSNRRRGMSCSCLFGLGVPELVVIAGVTALVFGPKQLPEVGRSLGKTIKSFQKGINSSHLKAAKEFETELKKDSESSAEQPTEEATTASEEEKEKKGAQV